MLYDSSNARFATVHDIEAGKQLRQVLSVDAEAGVVTMYCEPLRLNRMRGEVETFKARFARIYSIWDRGVPVLFHCYGRIQ